MDYKEQFFKTKLRDILEGKIEYKHFNWSIKPKLEKDWNEDMFKGKDNCIKYSYENWKKTYPIGAKRVRGLVNNIDIIYPPTNEPQFHYWVETDKIIIDESGVNKTVAPKQEWYEFLKISNIEYANMGLFLNNNYDLNIGHDTEEMEKDILLFYKKKGINMIVEPV
jgi:hypothetical protein